MLKKLMVFCGKCPHEAYFHNPDTGKHECKVDDCDCQWFQIPKGDS